MYQSLYNTCKERYRECRFQSDKNKKMAKQCYCQNVLYVAVKNQDLDKNKTQTDY